MVSYGHHYSWHVAKFALIPRWFGFLNLTSTVDAVFGMTLVRNLTPCIILNMGHGSERRPDRLPL